MDESHGRGSGQDILMVMSGIGIVLHAKSNGMKRICGWVEIRSQTSALTADAVWKKVIQMKDNFDIFIIILAVVIVCILSLLITKAIWNSNLPDWLKFWLLIGSKR